MAFLPANLSLMFQAIGGKWRCWSYISPDPVGDVDATDYFANVAPPGLVPGYGIQEGDWVIVIENDTDPPNVTLTSVTAIDSDGNATVAAVAFAGAATFTDLTATGAVRLGDAAADTVGFHDVTGVSQRAGSNQATSNVVTSASFGTLQVAQINEIQNALAAKGFWKGSA